VVHRTGEERSSVLLPRSDTGVPEQIAVDYRQKVGFERKPASGRMCPARDEVDSKTETRLAVEERPDAAQQFPPVVERACDAGRMWAIAGVR
jgi:hypothetical protein